MKNILLLFIFSFVCNAQEIGKNCDTKYLVQVESNIEKLTEKEIAIYLRAFEKECFKNVEFSEYYNELLFKIAEKHPQEVLNSLNKIALEKRYLILREFENAVVEVDNRKLIDKIKSCRGNGNLKKSLINAIAKNK